MEWSDIPLSLSASCRPLPTLVRKRIQGGRILSGSNQLVVSRISLFICINNFIGDIHTPQGSIASVLPTQDLFQCEAPDTVVIWGGGGDRVRVLVAYIYFFTELFARDQSIIESTILPIVRPSHSTQYSCIHSSCSYWLSSSLLARILTRRNQLFAPGKQYPYGRRDLAAGGAPYARPQR